MGSGRLPGLCRPSGPSLLRSAVAGGRRAGAPRRRSRVRARPPDQVPGPALAGRGHRGDGQLPGDGRRGQGARHRRRHRRSAQLETQTRHRRGGQQRRPALGARTLRPAAALGRAAGARVVDRGADAGQLRVPVLRRGARPGPPGAVREVVARIPFRVGAVVQPPTHYANMLLDAGCKVDVWETTYLHQLTGEHPVLEWITGTALVPVRERLDDDAWEQFREELIPLLRDAYPPRADGTTIFPFRRVFIVAEVGSGRPAA
ncbi:hypothetical protein MAP_3790 [Mycobacterium avium subsp. paratuberculosis K-10]|uniref:Trans-aconitate 2-methyltransferase n=1 Tax=Mycolicibacterium paratuberculosis (strain ATCC BAA-968 / K-10) TaxID=262316 RepID=Q73TC8_MYCPA|nr:hypothetical protein MAP_3790 [Mycobacterium avium subsp. paratuberculosis K-10]